MTRVKANVTATAMAQSVENNISTKYQCTGKKTQKKKHMHTLILTTRYERPRAKIIVLIVLMIIIIDYTDEIKDNYTNNTNDL